MNTGRALSVPGTISATGTARIRYRPAAGTTGNPSTCSPSSLMIYADDSMRSRAFSTTSHSVISLVSGSAASTVSSTSTGPYAVPVNTIAKPLPTSSRAPRLLHGEGVGVPRSYDKLMVIGVHERPLRHVKHAIPSPSVSIFLCLITRLLAGADRVY